MTDLTGKTIFVVEEDWQDEGEGGHNIRVFSEWGNALKAYEALIEYEKKNPLVADSIANDDVEYETEEDDNYFYVIKTRSGEKFRSWSWYEKGCYDVTHSDYILRTIVVDEEIKLY